MAVLHVVNRSPGESTALARCLASFAQGDALLLIENGVYAALDGTLGNPHTNTLEVGRCFVLGPDLERRALSGRPLAQGFEVVDFDRFVDLVSIFDVSVSWA